MQQKWNQNFDGEPMADIPQKFLNAGCDVYMVMQLRHDEKILDERYKLVNESVKLVNKKDLVSKTLHFVATFTRPMLVI